MNTEDQILRGTKLIAKNIKKQRLKPRMEFKPSKIQYKEYNTKSITKIKTYIYNLFFKKQKLF